MYGNNLEVNNEMLSKQLQELTKSWHEYWKNK